ncbi:radical SAM protein [Kitasatospora sp. MMS16-BH015]|uniref:radical SAM protein n=1 Tax=Kitasatospora sp. MMS16-BH015 TaxID=2018025 RepID=UPI000CA2D4E0|nr:radical SAM protein [Kitasatospora sp. MMS16-BH015]AUG78990.1 radical SAM protein [Kitasatospora sp. MMS16-BH015]
MELAELVGLRPSPGAGLLVTLTERCPLSCAHCSTSSTMRGGQPGSAELLRFVGSFGPDDRPELMLLTGGEPLLRPALAAALATTARAAGTRTALLSGMYFARQPRIPAGIRAAVRALDHFSASIDVFHEREVPRAEVFRALREILDAGVPISLHATGSGPEDPYLAGLTADVRRAFGADCPMLVNELRSVGRAAAWAEAGRTPAPDGRPLPCAMAAWPVVAPDGAVLACCNQDTVDRRPAPPHLLLGTIDRDDWPTVRRRALDSPALRMLRAVGPGHLYARYGDPADCTGYCAGCRALPAHPEVLAATERAGRGPVGALLDLHATRTGRAAGPAALVRRFGSPRYAELVHGVGESGPDGLAVGEPVGGAR